MISARMPTRSRRQRPLPARLPHQVTGLDEVRRGRAGALRDRQQPAEKYLWQALRQLPVQGSHFRRQVPIGPYIVDFACLAARLIIELDGGQHSRDDVAAQDRKRQLWLEAEGYRVLRFWNSDLGDNLEGVVETILAAL